jgi:CheY-like chemotaxis protein
VARLAKPLSGLRILVVEDELLILMMIEDMLSDLGCGAVVSAASVGEALALVAGQRFDIAMLDVNLGGSDSNAVAQALARRGVPFFYCTGNREANDAKDELARAVLRKPFSAEQLAAALSRLIRQDTA